MERQRIISQWQQVTPADYNAFADDPTRSLDNMAKDAITDEKGFVGFTVAGDVGTFELEVAAGRYWSDGKRFEREDDDIASISILSLIPIATKRIVSIVVSGIEDEVEEAPRSYINVDDETIDARVEPRVRRRIASVGRIAGVENVDPQPPTIGSNELRIANVLLGTGGIERIDMIDANRLVSIKSLHTRLVIVERRLDQAGSQIETLRTDISSIADQLKSRASQKMVTQMAFDLAVLRRNAELPNDYIGWDSDDFRDAWKSDAAHAGYNASVANGLRFGGVEALSELVRANTIDDRVTVVDNMVSAVKRSAQKRLSVLGKTGDFLMGSTQLENIAQVRLPVSRKVVEWTSKRLTETQSLAGWTPYADLSAGPYPVDEAYAGTSLYVNARSYVRGYVRRNPTTGVEEVLQFNHIEYLEMTAGVQVHHVHDFWQYGTLKTVDGSTWVATQTNSNVNGYHFAQTFLNSQSGTIEGINLFFVRKQSSGDFTVTIAETDASGKPDSTRVITSATIAPAAIVPDLNGETPTYIALPPRQLEKGKLYAIWCTSLGSHGMAHVSGAKSYAQGAFFVYQSDGWLMGNPIDIPFELFFQSYAQTRIEVALDPITLPGGISYLSANFDAVEPPGTACILEGRTTGDWFPIPFSGDMTNPLASMPATVQLRMVMLGTTDDMPSFGIGANRSCVTARREGTSLAHFSEALTLESVADTVEVRLKGYGYDPAHATMAVKIIREPTGANVTETVDVVADLPLVRQADGAFHKSFLFNLGGSMDDYVIKIEGTCDAGHDFVVSERSVVAYDA